MLSCTKKSHQAVGLLFYGGSISQVVAVCSCRMIVLLLHDIPYSGLHDIGVWTIFQGELGKTMQFSKST